MWDGGLKRHLQDPSRSDQRLERDFESPEELRLQLEGRPPRCGSETCTQQAEIRCSLASSDLEPSRSLSGEARTRESTSTKSECGDA